MKKDSKYIEVGFGAARGDDSYSIGMEAARLSIQEITIHPISAVLVFASIKYNLPDLLAGISRVVGDVPILGSTTAGEICNQPVRESVVVTILASPFLRVRLGVGNNVSGDWSKAVKEAIGTPEIQPFFTGGGSDIWQETTRQGKSIFSLLFSPGTTKYADSSAFEILDELRRLSDYRIPFFGGGAADDWKMESNFILCGREAHPDSLLVAVFETSLRFGISMGHGFFPTHKRAVATKVCDHEIIELDGKRAADVYAQLLGSDIETLVGKHLTLTSSQPSGIHDMLDQYRINVASYFTPEGRVRFTQPIAENTTIEIMQAQPDDLITAGRETLRKAILRGQITRPVVTFAFSCALRQHILKDDLQREIESMQLLLPNVPILGYYSFGEQGLLDAGVSRHGNECLTLLVLGDELTASAEVAIENQRLLKRQRENETFINAIVENIPDMIFVKDAKELRFVRFNRAGEELLGHDREELIGKNDYDFFPAEEADFFTSKDREVLLSKKLQDIPEEFIQTNNRGVRILHTKKIPILGENDEPKYLLGISEDITQNKQLEERLRRTQRLEALGTLAGGIAHDFNNVLYPLMGFAELLKDDLPADSGLQDHVDEILNAALRLKDLVQQILAFSSKGSRNTIPVTLQSIVREAIKLLRATIPATIEIQESCSVDRSVILADPTQIQQVVMNLAVNAYHAMEESGGKLRIDITHIDLTLESEPIVGHGLEPGSYALLTVSDTGIGIEKSIMDKIFDPYFTTKGVGKGTGLGLSVVLGIVKAHKGDIQISSKSGKGTEVKVYFPLMNQPSENLNPEVGGPAPGGTEKILLVDDEESIIHVNRLMLEKLGYHVTSRMGSIEALELFNFNPDAFDLVLTDMAMPNMTGIQLTEKLISIRPEIPIIICTGYSERIDEDKANAFGIKGFLMKPVLKSDMARMVRKVLDDSNSNLPPSGG